MSAVGLAANPTEGGPPSGPEVGEDGEHPAVLASSGDRPSLAKTLPMCFSTVLAETTSRSAMAVLE